MPWSRQFRSKSTSVSPAPTSSGLQALEPWAARSSGRVALAHSPDHVDDPDRAEQGKDESRPLLVVEDVVGDETGDERPSDADQHRLEERHRVAPRQEETGEGADDESADGDEDD